ncbi:MAG: hypothetical protein BGO05_29855 [Rhizobiales bacterium 63-7]|uniref:hypothetical protein n=1 Tax=Rhizobium sp. YJ-22 TaxID=3037556 RepID=UPI00092873F5|nr:hypothetical protein [Rhizobium sp. YJ-22]MBN9029634.1 hypothetical protein [Hyphomicrobiales bacterium]MDG3576406.1 hypothetical protein [Rhizobium sp. YJ-22]OJU70890.1 MAG: hypothetical protein BGO05_29855 [Rhizobiales bacterium 63-7]
MTDEDKQAQKAVEKTRDAPAGAKPPPPAGPHAKERLTDESKTPGAGTLPDAKEKSVNPGAG